MNPDSIKDLTELVVKFRDERDWAKFHTGKNLATALVVEASELLELYQWSEEPRKKEEVSKEAADVLYHLLLFCEKNKINLGIAFKNKLKDIAKRYPIELSKGGNKKYTDF